MFGICYTSNWSSWTFIWNSWKKVRWFFYLNNFKIKIYFFYSLINTNFINPVNTFVTGEVIVERNEHNVREALRQINIQMINSTNLYDGLETLWLGSADESLSNQQVYN